MARLIILRLLESYFRHRWLYLAPLLLMSALAGFYAVRTPSVYIATGTLYVQKESLLTTLTSGDTAFSWTTPAQVTVNELKELIQTDAFVRSAIHSTSLEADMASGPKAVDDTIQKFREAVSFSPLGDNLVQFSGKYKDPQISQQIATATLNSYVQWKLNADNQNSIVAQEFFSKIIEPYQNDLQQARDAMKAYLEQHPDPVRGDRPMEEQIQIKLLQSSIDQAATRVSSAMEKHEAARLAQAKAESDVHQNYTVVDAPKLPTRPTVSLSDRVKSLAPFVVVGLILSIGGILGGSLIDRSLRFAIDVRHGLDLPVLAILSDQPARVPVLVNAPAPSEEPAPAAAPARNETGNVELKPAIS